MTTVTMDFVRRYLQSLSSADDVVPYPPLRGLLESGRLILRQQQLERRQFEVATASLRSDSWERLRETAQFVLGEMAGQIPGLPPSGFTAKTNDYTIELHPFGAAPLWVYFRKSNDRWAVMRPFRVGIQFAEDQLNPDGRCNPIQIEQTQCLAVAVALCDAATPIYQRVHSFLCRLARDRAMAKAGAEHIGAMPKETTGLKPD